MMKYYMKLQNSSCSTSSPHSRSVQEKTGTDSSDVIGKLYQLCLSFVHNGYNNCAYYPFSVFECNEQFSIVYVQLYFFLFKTILKSLKVRIILGVCPCFLQKINTHLERIDFRNRCPLKLRTVWGI